MVHEGYYRSGRGRALMFDGASYDESAEPLLEVRGSLWPWFQVNDVTLLGADWLVVGRSNWEGYPAEFRVISTARRGIVDFYDGDPTDWDFELWTTHAGGRVAHVGDRDGDGQVDLAVAVYGDTDHFFPALTAGHIDDAPEIWEHDLTGVPGGDILHGAADLDGDGLDDGWIASTSADGATGQPYAGRVYLVPNTGPGVFLLEADAPAEIRGETIMDWTGGDTATGDLDGDGQDDLVVGAGGNYQLARHPGKVMAFLGPLAGVYTVADADALCVSAQADHGLRARGRSRSARRRSRSPGYIGDAVRVDPGVPEGWGES